MSEEAKKKGMPWWGWAIIAFLGIGLLSNAFGGDDETQVVEEAVSEEISEEAPAPEPEPVEEIVENQEVVGNPELLANCDGLNETAAAAILASVMVDETTAALNDGIEAGTPEALEAAVETVRESGEGYVELATIFRDADDCGDAKFGQMKVELADSIEALGENYSSWSYDLLLEDDSLLGDAIDLMLVVVGQSDELSAYMESAG